MVLKKSSLNCTKRTIRLVIKKVNGVLVIGTYEDCMCNHNYVLYGISYAGIYYNNVRMCSLGHFQQHSLLIITYFSLSVFLWIHTLTH